MPACELCPREVDGEALLCEECRLDTISMDASARTRAIWGRAQ